MKLQKHLTEVCIHTSGIDLFDLAANDTVLSSAPWELLKQFVNDALQFEQTQDEEETRIFTINEKLLAWQVATERPKRPLDSVFIQPDLKKEIVTDIDIFLKSKEFYGFHGIPYKRGYLLYGPPGTTTLYTGAQPFEAAGNQVWLVHSLPTFPLISVCYK